VETAPCQCASRHKVALGDSRVGTRGMSKRPSVLLNTTARPSVPWCAGIISFHAARAKELALYSGVCLRDLYWVCSADTRNDECGEEAAA